ncbi:hypothetical protein QPK24_11365 [Paenibacillus polygoni]|uniref:Uncharacterized protein n=1 Tax=Paenibacillus polygoni TaxID=3050112 RepID=A0ABY8X6R3_9BACL|nr:hypothetical protein [Paenibacillus polygoni]WIV21225.1 hypothetical protein QPK24_11365 [Paenibacillus polygoni]
MIRDGEKIVEVGKVTSTTVFKVSPEQKEILERQSEVKLEKAYSEALTKIRERYNQRMNEIRKNNK